MRDLSDGTVATSEGVEPSITRCQRAQRIVNGAVVEFVFASLNSMLSTSNCAYRVGQTDDERVNHNFRLPGGSDV